MTPESAAPQANKSRGGETWGQTQLPEIFFFFFYLIWFTSCSMLVTFLFSLSGRNSLLFFLELFTLPLPLFLPIESVSPRVKQSLFYLEPNPYSGRNVFPFDWRRSSSYSSISGNCSPSSCPLCLPTRYVFFISSSSSSLCVSCLPHLLHRLSCFLIASWLSSSWDGLF
jgi:hypothetical protein